MSGTDEDLAFASLRATAARVAAREISPVELVRVCLERCERAASLGAFWDVHRERAEETAKEAEAEIGRAGPRHPLHGIPIAHKDLFDTAGCRTTAGAGFWAERVPHEDAAVVERLASAGAISLGKLAMDELAFGVNTQNVHFGACRNPWDRERIPGGSSGGSGAAVAAGLCFAATGTDTGGSIRIPSSLCGTVGIKPTYGRVSRRGVAPMSWSQDHVGPLARSVADAALVLECMSGGDPRDPTSVQRPAPELGAAAEAADVRGLRIGFVRGWSFERCDREVREACEHALTELERLGATLVEIAEIDGLEQAVLANLAISLGEFATAYGPVHDEQGPEAFGPGARLMMRAGRGLTARRYLDGQRVRARVREGFERAFARVDLIASAGTAIRAPRIGEDEAAAEGGPVLVPEALCRFAAPMNLSGLPAVVLPVAWCAGLPASLQLAARPFAETDAVRAAAALEASLGLPHRRPEIDDRAAEA